MSDQAGTIEMGEANPVELDLDDTGLDNPGILSYAEPESVCGDDNRTQVSPATNFPYYWICSLRMDFGGDAFIGSGWLYNAGSSKYHVIATSGHCVWGAGNFADSITVIPGRDGNSAPFGSVTVKSDGLRASEGWKAQGPEKANFDYGAILVPKSSANWGSMGWLVASDGDLQNRVISNTGYPGDKPSGTLWSDGGPITIVEPKMFRYMNDTAGGQSGSPAYTWGNDSILYGVGIHGYGGCPNGAVRITNDVAGDYKAWGAS